MANFKKQTGMKSQVTVLEGEIETSAAFENKLAKIVKEAIGRDAEIVLWSVEIELGSSAGHYFKTVTLEVDKTDITLRRTSTSSPDYDYYRFTESGQRKSNFLKRLALDVVEELSYEIAEELNEGVFE